MSDPCDLYITRCSGPNTGDIVRIEARDGPKILATIELSMNDFATVLIGGTRVGAAFSQGGKP